MTKKRFDFELWPDFLDELIATGKDYNRQGKSIPWTQLASSLSNKYQIPLLNATMIKNKFNRMLIKEEKATAKKKAKHQATRSATPPPAMPISSSSAPHIWTDEEVQLLRDMKQQGYSYLKMAKKLGKWCTPKKVSHKLSKLDKTYHCIYPNCNYKHALTYDGVCCHLKSCHRVRKSFTRYTKLLEGNTDADNEPAKDDDDDDENEEDQQTGMKLDNVEEYDTTMVNEDEQFPVDDTIISILPLDNECIKCSAKFDNFYAYQLHYFEKHTHMDSSCTVCMHCHRLFMTKNIKSHAIICKEKIKQSLWYQIKQQLNWKLLQQVIEQIVLSESEEQLLKILNEH